MKKIFFFFIILYNLFTINSLSSTVYLDVQYIIDNSKIGLFYKNKLQKKYSKLNSDLNNEENKLKEKETEINNQKNILKKEEIKKKFNQLNILLQKYQTNRQKLSKMILEDKQSYSNIILSLLNPLLTKYVETNDIKLVIEKKNVLVGVKTLDITKDILSLIDEETIKKKLIDEN
tara:strand:- start:2262 stop:2786 length:525 start_codon:yes stop_codon:yes gene_type:complete